PYGAPGVSHAAPRPGSTPRRDRRHARGTPRAGCTSARPRRIPPGREVVHPELMPVPELVALDVAADPDAWRALGFTIDEEGVCAVDGVAIRLGSAAGKISGWAVAGVEGGVVLDGLPAVPAPPPADTGSHANGTAALDHVVVMSPDPARTTEALRVHGIEPRRQRHTDQYGPPFTQTFFRLGRPILE